MTCNCGKMCQDKTVLVDKVLHYQSRTTSGNHDAVFLRTVITESYRVKILVLPTEIFRKVATLTNIHAPEIEIFQSAKVAILKNTA